MIERKTDDSVKRCPLAPAAPHPQHRHHRDCLRCCYCREMSYKLSTGRKCAVCSKKVLFSSLISPRNIIPNVSSPCCFLCSLRSAGVCAPPLTHRRRFYPAAFPIVQLPALTLTEACEAYSSSDACLVVCFVTSRMSHQSAF